MRACIATLDQEAAMATARLIAFKLYEGDVAIVQGEFVVTGADGISCFGSYKTVESASGAKCPIFEGAVIEHKLKLDGAVAMTLSLYAAEETTTNKLGSHQVRVLRSGIGMGCESGESEAESVMLGNNHEFVFQTRIAA
jgi:hypothetical protein